MSIATVSLEQTKGMSSKPTIQGPLEGGDNKNVLAPARKVKRDVGPRVGPS